MTELSSTIDRRLDAKNQDVLEVPALPPGVPVRCHRQFIDPPTLMLLRTLAGQYPSSIWQVRGRAAIYPALSRREWLWLRDWCEFAEGREVKQDHFFYYQRTGGRVLV